MRLAESASPEVGGGAKLTACLLSGAHSKRSLVSGFHSRENIWEVLPHPHGSDATGRGHVRSFLMISSKNIYIGNDKHMI